MNEKEVNESENINNNHEENRDLILKLDKQVALGLWIQVIGQVIESTALSQLLVLNGDPSDPNLKDEETIVLGSWMQTIGQLLEARGIRANPCKEWNGRNRYHNCRTKNCNSWRLVTRFWCFIGSYSWN
jgi:hypothetical protein